MIDWLEEEEQLLQRKYSTLPLSSVESDALFTLTRSTINLSRRRLENIAPLDAHCSARLLAPYGSLFSVHSQITFGRKATQSKSTSVVLVTASVFPSGLFLEANAGSAWTECRAPRHQCSTSSLKAGRGWRGAAATFSGKQPTSLEMELNEELLVEKCHICWKGSTFWGKTWPQGILGFDPDLWGLIGF